MKQNKKILTFQPAPSSKVKIIKFQLLLFVLYLIYLAIPNLILEKFKYILPLRGYLFGDGKFDDLINTIQFGYSNFDLKWILDIKKDLVWPNSPLASFLSNLMKFFVSGPQDAPFFIFCLIAIFIILIVQKINFKFYGWLVIFNFPIVFLFSRGNTDILSLFFLVLIVSECLKKRDLMVSIYIGLLAALKFPFIILVLGFFKLEKIKYVVTTIITFFSVNFLALLYFPYSIVDGFKAYIEMLDRYHLVYIIRDGGTLWNNSVYGLLKATYLLGTQSDFVPIPQAHLLLNLSYFVTGIILIFTLYFLNIRIKLNSSSHSKICVIYILLLNIILIGPVSATYRLALLSPFIIWFYYNSKGINPSTYFIYACLCFPKSLFWWHNLKIPVGFTLDSIVNPIFIFILLILVLKDCSNSTEFNSKLTQA